MAKIAVTMKLCFIFIILLIYSCASSNLVESEVSGKYSKNLRSKGKFSIDYNLILNTDKSFSLSIKTQDANPKCNAEWELKANNILLKCYKSNNIIEMLSSGYMKKKEYHLKLLNRNKIEFENVILKRK